MNALLPMALVLALCVRAGSARAAEFECLLEPFVVVDASTAVEGVLETVAVRRGDLVEKGEVLATLQSKEQRASVAYARARASTTAARRSLQARVKQRRAKHRRAMELAASRFVSPDELEELEAEVEVAEQALREEAENASLAALELERVSELLAVQSIKSPIDGVVVERYLAPGEFAKGKPVVRIAQLDPLNVEAVLPVAVYGTIEVGMRGLMIPEAPVGGEYEAEVKVVDRVIDATSGTFRVRLELPNPGNALPAGLECRVRFPAQN